MKIHRACKICGEIGHTYKEHQDGCPYCEASHLGEECPTTQVTCFMCEGTNHNPAQCRLLTVTQEVVQQQRKGVKKAIQEFMATPMKKRKKDISYITCHKCGNKGHYSSKCRARGTMPTRVRIKRERKMGALLQPVPRIEKREREMGTLEQRSPMTCQE